MPTMAETDVRKLWNDYKRTRSERARDRLIEQYLPVVRFNAERIHAKLPSEVDVEDLVSAGYFGLMDAIESFDLGRGVKFETYCSPRIRGAILDELRNLDWVPRLVRNRAARIEQATKSLQNQLGRLPNDDELARTIGVDKEEFGRIVRDAHATGMLPLSRKMAESSTGEGNDGDFLKDPRGVSPLDEAQKRDLRSMLKKCLDSVEQLVLVLYYFEGLTMKEIGVTLNLSESRVSQMHSAILERLRRNLSNLPREVLV